MIKSEVVTSVHSHSERVGLLMLRFINHIGHSSLASTYYRAGKLHDIGKLIVDDEVLFKESKLSRDEYESIKHHVLFSAIFLKFIGETKDIVDCALYHHENFDGTGYVNNIIGEGIPYIARVCRVCDVYDALRESRPYKSEMSIIETFKEMDIMNANKCFDPEIYKAFKEMILSS